MTESQQKEELLNLVEVFLYRLSAYFTFSEAVRIMIGDSFVDEIIAETLREPALKEHVALCVKQLAVDLQQSEYIDPDQVLRGALTKWSGRGKPQ